MILAWFCKFTKYYVGFFEFLSVTKDQQQTSFSFNISLDSIRNFLELVIFQVEDIMVLGIGVATTRNTSFPLALLDRRGDLKGVLRDNTRVYLLFVLG